ncbi:MAG: ABC transporter substrate-binding protein [Eubacteriales bacterium]|jgi:branched-chain amino acid transport system substrate-binding protein
MKKFLAAALAAALAATTLTACGGDTGTSTSGEGTGSGDGINLGVLAPLTGEVSVYGKSTVNGIQLAIDEINEAGGINGMQIVANIQDEKGDVDEAMNAFRKMEGEGIVGLIGDVTSKPSLAVAELAAEVGLAMITPTGTSSDITLAGDTIFRTCFTDPQQGQTMATFAKDNLGASTAAVLRNNSDEYSQGVADAFVAAAGELGLEVVADEGYGKDDVDFKTQLTKIASLNPDVLFVPEYYEKDAMIAIQARDAGYTNPILGADGWDGVLTQLTADNMNVVDNCYYSNHYDVNDTTEVVANFVSKYKETYNEDPTAFSALGYDAVYQMKAAIEAAGSTDRAAIAEALASVEIDGVTGHIKFDENGDTIKDIAVIKYENGASKLETKITK